MFYPWYEGTDPSAGMNPLADQNVSGAVMMIEEMLLTVGLLAWLFFRLASQDEQRQELLDLAADRGIPLSDERAARAARAGTIDQLRERLLRGVDDPAPPSE